MAKKRKNVKTPIETEGLALGPHDLRFNDPLKGHTAKIKRDNEKRDKEIKNSYLT